MSCCRYSRGEQKIYTRNLADYENLEKLLVIYLNTTLAQTYGQSVINQDFRILVTLEHGIDTYSLQLRRKVGVARKDHPEYKSCLNKSTSKNRLFY